jgi:hypothetical protein
MSSSKQQYQPKTTNGKEYVLAWQKSIRHLNKYNKTNENT